MNPSSSKAQKILVVFDFDSTIVEASCDHYVLNVISDKNPHRYQGSNYSRNLPYPSRTMWDMPPIYRTLQEKGVKPTDILKCLDEIKFVSGMRDLMLDLARRGHEIVIISDCNSVFVGHTLRKAGVQDCVTDIFTNPAWFDEKGRLRLTEYHHQDWCTLCPPNLCKGHILRNYLRKRYSEGEEFLYVAYVGDGQNDYCPALCLDEQDVVFPRAGYDLHKTIRAEAGTKDRRARKVKAKVVPWEDGNTVKRALIEEMRRYR